MVLSGGLKFAVASLEQYSNAPLSMMLTLPENLTVVSSVHWRNMSCETVVTPLPSVSVLILERKPYHGICVSSA